MYNHIFLFLFSSLLWKRFYHPYSCNSVLFINKQLQVRIFNTLTLTVEVAFLKSAIKVTGLNILQDSPLCVFAILLSASEYTARLSCIPFLQLTVVSFSVIASALFSLIHQALWLIFTKSVMYNIFPPFLFLFIFFGCSYKNKLFLRRSAFLIAAVLITSYYIFLKTENSLLKSVQYPVH